MFVGSVILSAHTANYSSVVSKSPFFQLSLTPRAMNKHLRQTLPCISLITVSFDKINDVRHLSTMKWSTFRDCVQNVEVYFRLFFWK